MPPSFVAPWFLLALPAALIPLIIHFIARRRRHPQQFSSLRFFSESLQRTMRRNTLRVTLLLLVRIAIILCLVLLFARPFIPVRDAGGAALFSPQRALYCWIDPTISMSCRIDTTDLLQRAGACIDTVAARMPPEGELHLYMPRQQRFRPLTTGRAVAAGSMADSIHLRYGPSGLDACIEAFAAIKERGKKKTLVLLSDFHRSALPDSTLRRRLQTLADNGADTWCVSVAPGYAVGRDTAAAPALRPNVAVASARVIPGAHPRVQVRCVRSVARDSGAYSLVLLQDNAVVATRSLVFAPGRDSSETGFSLRAGMQGALRGAVVVQTDDCLARDDTAYFAAADAAARRRILVAGPYEKCYPLVAALTAVYGAHGEDDATGTHARITHRSVAALTPADIDSASVCVFNQVSVLPRWITTRLAGTRDRKVCILAPAADTNAVSPAGDVFSAFGVQPRLRAVQTGIEIPATRSGLWEGFSAQAGERVMITRAYTGLPGSPLIRLRTGSTLFSLYTDRHVWGFFATPLGLTRANNLYQTGLYVPFVDRCLQVLLARCHAGRGSWVAGRSYPNPSAGPADANTHSGVTVYGPDNEPVATWHTQSRVSLPRPGIYRLETADGTSRPLAVTHDITESPRSYCPVDSAACCGGMHTCHVRELCAAATAAGSRGPGLSRWCGYVLLALLCMEFLLWRRRRRVQH
jgi:hypothetical protein